MDLPEVRDLETWAKPFDRIPDRIQGVPSLSYRASLGRGAEVRDTCSDEEVRDVEFRQLAPPMIGDRV